MGNFKRCILGFVLKYCDVCHKRIPEEDFLTAEAVEWNGRTFCKLHVPSEVQTEITQQEKRSTTFRKSRKTGVSNRYASPAAARSTTPAPRMKKKKPSPPPGRKPSTPVKISESERTTRRRGFPKKKKSSIPIIVILLVVISIVLVTIIVLLMSEDKTTPTTTGTEDKTKTEIKTDIEIMSTDKTESEKTDDKNNGEIEDPLEKEAEEWDYVYRKIADDYRNYISPGFESIDREELNQLGTIDYAKALKLQEKLKNAKLKERIDNRKINKLNTMIISFGEHIIDKKREEIEKKINELIAR